MRKLPRAWSACFSNAWGGLERVALRDAELLTEAGGRPRLAVLPGSPIDEAAKKTRVEIERVPFVPLNHLDVRMREVLRRARADGFDLVHLHQPSLLGSIVPWLPRSMKLVVSRHLLSGHRKTSIYHRWLYRRVDRLLAIGDSMRENLLATHPLPASRVKTIFLGIDLARFDPRKWPREEARSAAGVPYGEFVFGLVGRLDPAKGQRTALEAFSLLENRERAQLWFVGEETRGRPGEKAVLENLAHALGVAKRVKFFGSEPEVPRVLSAMDGLLMPSQEEAFGLVAIEGMAMGVPALLSSSGSGPEISGPEGEFALLAPPGDIGAWAVQMDFLQRNPKAAQELGKRGQESARSRFDERLRLRRTLELYSEILFDKVTQDLYI